MKRDKNKVPPCPIHANSGAKMLPIDADWHRCRTYEAACMFTRRKGDDQFVTDAVLRREPHPTNKQGQTVVVRPATTISPSFAI